MAGERAVCEYGELGHNSWHMMIAAWSVSGEIAHTQDQFSVKHDERRAWKAEEESELTVATFVSE